MAGPLAPAGAPGKVERNQTSTISGRMIRPARLTKMLALSHRLRATFSADGSL